MIFNLDKLFRIVRFIVYIWVALESALLCFLYTLAFREMKKSPIIKNIRNLFGAIAVFFVALSMIPIAKLNIDVELGLMTIIFSFLVPTLALIVIVTLREFRKHSLNYVENDVIGTVEKKIKVTKDIIEGGDKDGE